MNSLQISKQDDGTMRNQVYTPKKINKNHEEGSNNFMQFSNKVQSMGGNNTPNRRSTAPVS
jgi:protein involved in sex pheromone biosynthesis